MLATTALFVPIAIGHFALCRRQVEQAEIDARRHRRNLPQRKRRAKEKLVRRPLRLGLTPQAASMARSARLLAIELAVVVLGGFVFAGLDIWLTRDCAPSLPLTR